MDYKDKVIVITGAGSGIGKALAIEFAKLGSKLALNDINKNNLNKTISILKKNTNIYSEIFDVSNKSKFLIFSKNIKKKYKNIDILINNAGVAHSGFTHENLDNKTFRKIMEINFWGTVNGTEIFLPIFKKQCFGSIVNMSSAFGLITPPLQIGYSTSKFAINAYSSVIQQELKLMKSKINLNLVFPGGIKTNITRNAIFPKNINKNLKKDLIEDFNQLLYLDPKKVAIKIIKGISKNKNKIYIGFDIRMVDFIQRFLPYYLSTRLFLFFFKLSRSYLLLFKNKK